MTRTTRPVISIFGSSATPPNTSEFDQARQLAQTLASQGADIACGGYAGIMEAVSQGARDGGGEAFGYTLPPMKGRSPNPYLSDDRPQTTLYDRLRGLIHDSDALIAVNGGIGTVVEVFLAWNELYLDLLAPRPLILVGEAWERAIEGLSELLEITNQHRTHLTFTANIEETAEALRRQGVLV